jgi:GDP-L-fucose synthase
MPGKLLDGKKVVVTGGKGFLGKHLVRALQKERAIVFSFTKGQYDLTERYYTETMLDDAFMSMDGVDIVYHLAARVSGIGSIAKNPGQFFYDNLMMGVNVIDACHRYAIDKVVVAGSVCAYPAYAPIPMLEANLYAGYPEESNSSYGIAKRTLHSMLKAYHEEYGTNGTYILMANLYGPGDNFEPSTSHVIPALIKKIDKAQKDGDESITVWGTGHASRDFLFVRDAVDAFVLAGLANTGPDPINIGAGVEIPISGLVEDLKKAMEFDGETIYDTSKPDGQKRRCLKTWYAEETLEWQPTTSLQSGLKETVAWYREQYP